MNLGTFVTLVILAVIVGLVIRTIVNDRKQGKASCGCSIGGCSGCAGCASHGGCSGGCSGARH